MDKLSYALGIGIGTQLSGMGASNLNIDDFAQAIKDVIAGNELKVDNKRGTNPRKQFFLQSNKQSKRLQLKKLVRLLRL